MTVKKNHRLNSLIHESEQGSTLATYQLMDWYRTGQFVEKDEIKAKSLFEKISQSLANIDIKIDKISAYGYRGFERIDIDFNSKYTVISGVNGSGKTAILECIAIGLSWIIQGITRPGSNGTTLKDSDISNAHNVKACSIDILFRLNESENFSLKISKSKQTTLSLLKSEYTQVKHITSAIVEVESELGIKILPIFAYYSVKRSLGGSSREIKQASRDFDKKKSSRYIGYEYATDASNDFTPFFDWLIKTCISEKYESSSEFDIQPQLYQLKADIKARFEMLNIISGESNNNPVAATAILASISEKQKQLDEIENKLIELNAQNTKRNKSNYILEAIQKFLPEISKVHVVKNSNDEFSLCVVKNEIELEISQLSQGEKSLVCLVGDIARRHIYLNGPDIPLDHCKGIIAIDEIDLHLHPKWQQEVIPNLLKTFKNVQFIFSTHSPQVASTIHDESLRIINNKHVISRFLGIKGAESSRVLEDVFDVPSRRKADENAKLLEEYLDLILNRKDIDSPKSKNMRAVLDKAFGDNEPSLKRADIFIANELWERKCEED